MQQVHRADEIRSDWFEGSPLLQIISSFLKVIARDDVRSLFSGRVHYVRVHGQLP